MNQRRGDDPDQQDEDGPALFFDDDTSDLPHWSEPATGEMPVFAAPEDEPAGGSRLFPELPDDPNMVDSAETELFKPPDTDPGTPAIPPPPTTSLDDGPRLPPPAVEDDPFGPADGDPFAPAPAAPSAGAGTVTDPFAGADDGDPFGDDFDDDPFMRRLDSDADPFAPDPADVEAATAEHDLADAVTLEPDLDPWGGGADAPAAPGGVDADAEPFGEPAEVEPAELEPLPEETYRPSVTAFEPAGVTSEDVLEPRAELDEVDEREQEAWATFDAGSPQWRENADDWDPRESADQPVLQAVPDEPPPPAPLTTGSWEDEAPVGAVDGGAGRDLPMAAVTGVVLAAAFLGLMWVSPGATLVLVVPLLVVAAAEFFNAVRHVTYRPATLLGVVTTGALSLAVYWKGQEAYPIVLVLFLMAGMVWYMVGVDGERPTSNLAVTALGVLWVGVLGSFAALILAIPTIGTGILLGAVIGTVGYDVGGYVIGRTTGQSRLAPNISPNKTYEGLIGGMIVSILVTTVGLGIFPGLHPWEVETIDALWLGVAIAVAAPLGDLAQSMIKRDLGIKDMGTLLPGHGGLLDRFDALLFVLPTVYYVARVVF